jgi:hypothetical protein
MPKLHCAKKNCRNTSNFENIFSFMMTKHIYTNVNVFINIICIKKRINYNISFLLQLLLPFFRMQKYVSVCDNFLTQYITAVIVVTRAISNIRTFVYSNIPTFVFSLAALTYKFFCASRHINVTLNRSATECAQSVSGTCLFI